METVDRNQRTSPCPLLGNLGKEGRPCSKPGAGLPCTVDRRWRNHAGCRLPIAVIQAAGRDLVYPSREWCRPFDRKAVRFGSAETRDSLPGSE